jgi:hypothetical protein
MMNEKQPDETKIPTDPVAPADETPDLSPPLKEEPKREVDPLVMVVEKDKQKQSLMKDLMSLSQLMMEVNLSFM